MQTAQANHCKKVQPIALQRLQQRDEPHCEVKLT